MYIIIKKIILPVVILLSCLFFTSFSATNYSNIPDEESILIEKLEKSFNYFDVEFSLEEKREIVNNPAKLVDIIESKNADSWFCQSKCGLEMQACLLIADTWPSGSEEWVKAFDKCFFDYYKCIKKCDGPGIY